VVEIDEHSNTGLHQQSRQKETSRPIIARCRALLP
jgi:hypothetical protein